MIRYKYKLECYRKEDDTLWSASRSNSLEWCMKQINKPYQNYYHKLFEKKGNKWVEVSIERTEE